MSIIVHSVCCIANKTHAMLMSFESDVSMNNKMFGIVFIIVGVVLAMRGCNIYDAASPQLSRAFNGETPIEAWQE